MCSPLCPERQRHILQLSCTDGIPQISVTEGMGSQPSPPRAVGHPCNLDLGQKSVPLYVIKMDGKSREGHLASSWSLSLNSTHLEDLLPPEPGIRNPTVCLRANDTLAFLVTHEHYPEYDLGHFYNTLEQFDWGRFRAPAEESQLYEHSLSLFLQQFQHPGIYVFRLSSNRHRKMYVRALPPGGQCFGEGPFASTTPRYLIQTGIARIPRPLKRSGWLGLLGEIVLLLGLCLFLMLKLLYLKLLREARSLQQLWGARRSLPASTNRLLGSVRREQQQAAEAAIRAAEEEASRRRHMAGEYAANLRHQLKLLHQDLLERQEQWASFCSALMEAQQLLKARTGSRAVPQLDTVLGHLSQVVLQEGHRLKAWGILGTGTGAELLWPAPAGPPGADDISVNPVTKLMVPGPNCLMLPASGHAGSIPSGYFIHPDTGRVLPEAGHLGYDLL
ncbi:PREDICTED: uncharacterized protein LOC105588708 [Cercocebus atys]|uniref:uncharacterized protein LOC105588708 n=1 Tax=Cercocebus atys TaxID=9531 RepID=UPI0005F4151E|nr:PREDICTED: uncharacterized protein LOC105588708 [Cercocebus atys]